MRPNAVRRFGFFNKRICLCFAGLFVFNPWLEAHPLDYWTEVEPGVTNSPDLNAVHYANGQWVIVGSGGTILLSTNATKWAPLDSGTTANLSDVAYGGGQWIAAGSSAIAHSA